MDDGVIQRLHGHPPIVAILGVAIPAQGEDAVFVVLALAVNFKGITYQVSDKL